MRFLGALLLSGFPVIDIGLLLYASPIRQGPIDWETVLRLLADIVSIAFFWLGLLLGTRSTMRFANRLTAIPRKVLRLVLGGLVATTVVYHFAYWSFIGANGHAPTPETVAFVFDNASQLPHHILQTAPYAAIASVLIATLVSLYVARLALTQFETPSSAPPGREILYAAVMMAAWFVLSGEGATNTPYRTVVDRDRILEARTNVALQKLAPRPDAPLGPSELDRRPSVIVILVESLRYDLLTTHPEAVPFFSQMYKEHAGLTRAYATASHSNLSDLAFWYSQYPLRGLGKETYPVSAPWRGLSLFDVFKANGYTTAYISSQNERWGEMINWLDTPAVDHFFHSESYEGETWENHDDIAGLAGLIRRGVTTAGKIEDSETLRLAKRWIDSLDHGTPFFLGMNLQNTHFSYVLSPDAKKPFQPSDLGFRAVYYRWPEDRKDSVRNRYLNSVLDVNNLLQDFVNHLQSRGVWDDLVFVVVGDNGEAFYEHGFGNHSGPMYEEVVRTLAFIKPSEGSLLPDGLYEAPVSHVDIAASIPALVGIPVPWSFQGHPITSDTCRHRPIFMYSNAIVRQYGVVDWPWKYLVTQHPEERHELYNLETDPLEQSNVLALQPMVRLRMADSVRLWKSMQTRYYQDSLYLERSPPNYCEDANEASTVDRESKARVPTSDEG
jgi:arylsulfatase A-like enzyme